MAFSSGRFDTLTTDPHPFARIGQLDPCMRNREPWDGGEFRPRPKFDRRLTNPKNWALHDARQFRASAEKHGEPAAWSEVRRAFESAVRVGFYRGYSDCGEMIAHARKVLTRLARIEAMNRRACPTPTHA